jgi:L-ascorbate metabolism protein UlaG (beta-lactamase superfamily)
MAVPHVPLRITMIGHSTVLFEIDGVRILTDPHFGRHGNLAYRRLAPPANAREEMTGVDLVLLSHDHWDHFDRGFFRMLSSSVPVIVPAATREWMRLRGVHRPVGIRPWESLRQNGVTVWGVPAHHFGVACGFVIERGRRRIYFAGDTFHGGFHRRIASELAPTVALLPVTTFRLPMTMGENQAVRAVCDLQPQVVIPIHLGLAPRSPLLRTSQTVTRFAEKLGAVAPGVRVVHLREGDDWEPEPGSDIAAGWTAGAVRNGAGEGRVAGPAANGVARVRSTEPAGLAPTPPATAPDLLPRGRRLAPVVFRLVGPRESVDSQPDAMQNHGNPAR